MVRGWRRGLRNGGDSEACVSGDGELLICFCSVLVGRGRQGNEEVDVAATEFSVGRNDEEVGGRIVPEDMLRIALMTSAALMVRVVISSTLLLE